MSIASIGLSTALKLIAAVTYGFVGWRLARRRFERVDERFAWRAFVTWWLALAVATALGVAQTLLALSGVRVLEIYVGISIVNILLICISLWGLIYYLVFLYTGTARAVRPLIIFYVLYFSSLVWMTVYRHPVGISLQQYTVSLEYDREISAAILFPLLFLLVFPQIIGALMYFRLFFKVTEPALRYRIALVSWSIIGWFGISFLAPFVGLSSQSWWPLASSVLGLAAALLIYLAYFPPALVQKKLDLNAAGQ